MIIRKIESKTALRKKRVTAYARVSTEVEEQQESLRTQVCYYETFIKQNPKWEYVEVYADSGRSGTSAVHRSEFQRMIADAKAGRMDIILVKSISRFSRNVVEAQKYVHELRAHEVEVRFEREAISSLDPASDMLFSVLAAVAQEESRSISENVKWSYRKHAKRGIRKIGNNRVLGYDTNKVGKLVPNGDAWIIKLIFARYADGGSLASISRELNEKGAKRIRSGNPFTTSSLLTILDNEIYVGDRLIQKAAPHHYLTKRPDITQSYNSYYLTDDHEGMIDRETWEKTKVRRERAKDERLDGIFKSERTHFLYGAVICGACGVRYRRRTIHGKGGKLTKVWECNDRMLGIKGSRCQNRIIAEEELLLRISEQLDLTWRKAEAFDEEAFWNSAAEVEVTKDSVHVRMRKNT